MSQAGASFLLPEVLPGVGKPVCGLERRLKIILCAGEAARPEVEWLSCFPTLGIYALPRATAVLSV